MIFAAQIDPVTNELKQGLGFSTGAVAQAHFEAHPEFFYISTDGFVSPSTHKYLDGQVILI